MAAVSIDGLLEWKGRSYRVWRDDNGFTMLTGTKDACYRIKPAGWVSNCNATANKSLKRWGTPFDGWRVQILNNGDVSIG